MQNGKTPFLDMWDTSIDGWSYLNESEGQGLPDGVLARVQTPVASMDSISLNRRFYSKACFEKALKDAEPRIGRMFGTIGHDIEMNEKAIASGDISHKVVSLKPNRDGVIIAEMHIVDTPAGRNLNTLMRQGLQIGVSTRAYGNVRKGKGPNGSDAVDENTFYLDTVDFVTNPGQPIAGAPKIVESTEVEEETTTMDKELFESMSKERIESATELRVALNEKVSLQSEIAELKAKVALYESVVGTPEVAKKLNEGMRKYAELEPFKSYAGETNAFKQDGVGVDNVMDKALQLTESYAKLGTVQALNEKIELLEKYKAFGSIEGITNGNKLLESFMQLSRKPEELKKLFEKSNAVIGVYHDIRRKQAARKIFNKFKNRVPSLNESWVNDMLGKLKAQDVIDSLKVLAEKAPAKVNGKLTPDGKPVSIAAKPRKEMNESEGAVADIFSSMNESFSGAQTKLPATSTAQAQ